MSKLYRSFRQWNNWLAHYPGSTLLKLENHLLNRALQFKGDNLVLIGVSNQHLLTTQLNYSQKILISPAGYLDNHATIESDFYNLPFLTSSLDMVLLPNTLERVENPRQLIFETARVIKPEGYIGIIGINPYSLWNASKYFSKEWDILKSSSLKPISTVKKWLEYAEFELVEQVLLGFYPPIGSQKWFNKLNWFDMISSKLFKPFCGVYLIIAKSKVVPLTPLRAKWKETLSSVSVSIPKPRFGTNLRIFK